MPSGENRLGLVLREPAGVVGIITPWNFPFIIVSERVPWALGAGCTVVVKPSEFTSGTTVRLAELALEAGMPPGVFNVITGMARRQGQVLAEDPRVDVLAFTGSVSVGTHLAAIAAPASSAWGWNWAARGRRSSLPMPISKRRPMASPTASITMPGSAAFPAAALLSPDAIRPALLERLLDLSRRLPFGDPLGEASRFGAMVSDQHIEKVAGYVASCGLREGAELLLGGDMVDAKSGNFFAPTVFDGVTGPT
jgi:acyl-CoA reductase-like NAD-dependent aldehyde dehydrogenase